MNTSQTGYRNGSTPTVLLVHGAFADASSWARVIPELLAAGIDVDAPANSLRGLATDAAYVSSVARAIDGPVLLVGHCYGGAVITVAGRSTSNVVGLVYVAAFAVDEGESALDVATRPPQGRLIASLRPATVTDDDGEPRVELSIKGDRFAEVFAADLPAQAAAVLAVSQRRIAAAALDEKARAAAWRTLPSWYLVATADQAIHPDAQRSMAQRAGAHTVEVDASHAVALTQSAAVAALIQSAAHAHPPHAGIRSRSTR